MLLKLAEVIARFSLSPGAFTRGSCGHPEVPIENFPFIAVIQSFPEQIFILATLSTFQPAFQV